MMALHNAEVLFGSDANNGIAKKIAVGQRFLFLNAEALSAVHETGQIIDGVVNDQAILAIPENESLSIAGMEFLAPLETPISWMSLTCDRMVYDELDDPVNFLIVACKCKNETVEVLVKESGRQIDSREVALNGSGVGTLRLPGMPIGEYEAVLQVEHETQSCQFSVARYRLAALVADLKGFRMLEASDENVEKTEVTMSLHTFGVPFHGRLKCDLIEEGKVIISRAIEVENGIAEVQFPFQGTGALSVNVQAEADPSKTATVILQGSGKDDRDEVTFSKFGAKLTGSLAATEGSVAIRGIHFVERGFHGCPVIIEPTNCGIRIEAGMDFDQVVIQVVDAAENSSGRLKVHRRSNFKRDERWEIDSEGPVCHVGVAGFVDGKPFEQWGSFVRNSDLDPQVEIAKPSFTGEKAKLKFSSNGAQFGYVIVKDARLPQSESMDLQLSRCIKESISDVRSECESVKAIIADRLRTIEGTLLARGSVSIEQLREARDLSKRQGISVCQALVKFDYLTSAQVAKALSEFSHFGLLDKRRLGDISEYVLELMPECVARDYVVFPLMEHPDGTLLIAAADPFDIDLLENLRFILNRNVEMVVATPEQIRDLINENYGQMEGMSADSILQEFTDTAIDFTSTIEDSASFALYDSEVVDSIGRIEIGSGDLGALELDGPRTSKPKRNETRDDKPGDVLFAKLLPLPDGVGELELDLPANGDEYEVSVIAFSDDGSFDWASSSERFTNMPDVFVSLDLPKFVHRKDSAQGKVYIRSVDGPATVSVYRQGRLIGEFETSGAGQLEMKSLQCTGGSYTATISVEKTGARATVTEDVLLPGVSKSVRRPTVVLKPGEKMEFGEELRNIQVFPGIDVSLRKLTAATCHYRHLCCEQTAAKVRAGVFSYLATPSCEPELLAAAEASIVAGINRMNLMWLRGQGFMSYPESQRVPNKHWGSLAAEHLLYVQLLQEVEDASSALRRAVQLGGEMALDVYHERNKADRRFGSPSDAYRVIRFSENDEAVNAVRKWAREKAIDGLDEDRDSGIGLAVWRRTGQAYVAACLFVGGEPSDVELAVGLANKVMSELDQDGRLYSTVDSVAAIAMMHEMRQCISSTESKSNLTLRVNGEEIEASCLREMNSIRTIEALEQPLVLRAEKLIETSWTEFKNNVSVEVSLLRRGKHVRDLSVGDAIDIDVQLVDGYQFGDYLDVCLPDSLSRVFGGSQVKQFAVDFAGKSALRVPLVATGASFAADGEQGPHHFSILIRNMYDEDRIACPAFLRANVLTQSRVKFHEV